MLDVVLSPYLCQMLAAAAKLKQPSQEHRQLCFNAAEFGVKDSGGNLALLLTLETWIFLLTPRSLSTRDRPNSG